MKKLPIKNYEGIYEVSNCGQITSLERLVKRNKYGEMRVNEKILKATPNKQIHYLTVDLWKNGESKKFYVHRLVAKAFIPNPTNLPEVNHINGNRQDNHISNLEWVDRLGNVTHAIKTGLKVYTNRLTREEFLECLIAVINGESYTSLSKRVPYQVPFLSVKLRKIAKEHNLEDLLNQSLQLQKQKRAKINETTNR